MNVRLRTWLLFLLVSYTSPSLACSQDPELLDYIHQTVNVSVWQVVFTQENHLSALSRPFKSSGIVYVDRTRGFVWRTQQPFTSDLVVREGGLEMNGTAVASSRLVAELLRALVAGEVQSLTTLFDWHGCRADDGWQLTLTPKDAQLAERIVQIEARGRESVQELIVSQPGNNTMHVQFEPHQPLEQLPDAILHILNAPAD